MTKRTVKNLDRLTRAELISLLRERETRYGDSGRSPVDIYNAVKDYATKETEHFLVVTLDGSHTIINAHLVTMGLVNRTLVHPREVFRPSISDNATAIVLVHNHPSGNMEPSADDLECTQRLRKAGLLLGIEVLDHIIISRNGYRSLMETGELL